MYAVCNKKDGRITKFNMGRKRLNSVLNMKKRFFIFLDERCFMPN